MLMCSRLWDTIRDFEEVKPIAQLAEEHYKQHGRPLRIAVDEADWRFNNLTMAQVYAIRDSTCLRTPDNTILIRAASNEPAFQGIEKAMFYRICKLLTLNIQLIFVFDGPGVPAKRGRNGGRRIDYERLRLLKQVLRCFGIPYQEAPGEAEAECARLQILGLVDAVWSQDSDCIMFGCSLWIHDDRVAKEKGNKDRSKENTRKSGKSIRIVRAKDMKNKLNLDREGLVLFAMLVGGDYHPTGLPGCGAGIALSAVKEGSLAQSLCLCRNQRDCVDWSYRLAAFLQTRSRARSLAIPANFPDYKILQKYYRPKVTSDELLMTKKSLDLDAPCLIDERKLLEVTSSRFNIWGRLYMNWVGPVLLTRSLLQRDSSRLKEIVHGIKLTKQRACKSEEAMALRCLERKITFSPFSVTVLQRGDFEGGDREGMWDGKRDIPFDPAHRVECDYFPAFWLQQVLPPDVLDPPPPAPKQVSSKRKEGSDAGVDDEASMSPAKKKQKSQKRGQVAQASHTFQPNEPRLQRQRISVGGTSSSQAETPRLNGKRDVKVPHAKPSRTHARQQETTEPCEVIDLSHLEDDLVLRLPPARPSKGLSAVRKSLSNIVDLGSPESSADESEVLARAIRLSMQSPHRGREAPDDTTASRHSCMSQIPQDVQTRSNALTTLVSTTEAAAYVYDNRTTSVYKCHAAVASELDQVRAARLQHFTSSPVAMPRKALSNTAATPEGIAAAADYIDLTED